jgi:hypothetical protein
MRLSLHSSRSHVAAGALLIRGASVYRARGNYFEPTQSFFSFDNRMFVRCAASRKLEA